MRKKQAKATVIAYSRPKFNIQNQKRKKLLIGKQLEEFQKRKKSARKKRQSSCKSKYKKNSNYCNGYTFAFFCKPM